MKSCYILLLCVSVFLLLGMGMSIFYKNNVLVAIKPLTDLASNTRSTYNRMLVEVPGMVPDDVYEAARGAQECAVIFLVWLWWLLKVIGNNIHACFMTAFEIPFTYVRKTQLQIRVNRNWKYIFGIDPCKQVAFWMTMENLVGIPTVEEYVGCFIIKAFEVMGCFYILYAILCMICMYFGVRVRHRKLYIFLHLLFWFVIINQHLQLWPALHDTFVRVKNEKSAQDWAVLQFKAGNITCSQVFFKKVD
jgi:hypothetical protein